MRSAREEIAAAAVRCFAREGFGASLRTVAADAGVSAALIVHHFGSKQGLIDACDAQVLGVADEKMRLMNDDGIVAAAAWVVQVMQEGTVQAYISRALAEGGDAGKRLFTSFVDVTEKALIDLDLPERRMTAAMLVTHSLGTMLLSDHIAAATGTAPYSAEGIGPLALAMTAIYKGALSPFLEGLD
jgi:TetR/AcrR family transcriptional regulator, regulator of cefoperazone and chloramphenicol sensitivity